MESFFFSVSTLIFSISNWCSSSNWGGNRKNNNINKRYHFGGLEHDCSNSSVLAIELLQSYADSLIQSTGPWDIWLQL